MHTGRGQVSRHIGIGLKESRSVPHGRTALAEETPTRSQTAAISFVQEPPPHEICKTASRLEGRGVRQRLPGLLASSPYTKLPLSPDGERRLSGERRDVYGIAHVLEACD